MIISGLNVIRTGHFFNIFKAFRLFLSRIQVNDEEGEFENWCRLNTAAIRAEFLHRCFVEKIFDSCYLSQKFVAENVVLIEFKDIPELSYFVIDGKRRLFSDCFADESLTQMLLPIICACLNRDTTDEEDIATTAPFANYKTWIFPFMSISLETALFYHCFHSDEISLAREKLAHYYSADRVPNREHFLSIISKFQHNHISEILHSMRVSELFQLFGFFKVISGIQDILKFSPEENTACFQGIPRAHIIQVTQSIQDVCLVLQYLSEDQKNIYIEEILPKLRNLIGSVSA